MQALRAIGCMMLLLAVVCVVLIFANWHTASIGGDNLKPLAIPAAFFCLLGIGLFFRRKFAAIVVVVGTVAWAIWLTSGTVRFVPLPWALVNIAFAIIMLIPAVLIVKNWRYLSRW